MSQLGKIFLYAALLGAVVAIVFGFLLTGKYKDVQSSLAQSQQEANTAKKQAGQAKQETKDALDAKAASDSKLTTANSKIDDLNTQLKTAQQQATDAATAASKANDAAKLAQDNLDTITKTLNGKTAAEIVASEAKAQSDLASAQSEQKIMQDQLQASQTQISTLMDEINRSKTGKMPAVSGKVTFVDHTWNFVVLDVGLTDGVVPNGELIVYRGRNFLGKVRVTKADPNDAVAEILPDIKGDIQVGDSVLN